MMKPIKQALPLAVWLLRISTVFLIAQVSIHNLKGWELVRPEFILALLFTLAGALLFIGGFLSNPWLTIVSGLFLFGLSVYKLVLINREAISPSSAIYLMLGTVALFFVANGNS